MLSLFSKREEEYVAVFDIGSGSICASIVKLSKKDLPAILYSYREPITFIPNVTTQRLLETMLKLLKSVSAHVQKEVWGHYHRKVHRAYCVFSAPWFVAQTRVITHGKEKPFLVTRSLIEDILRKDEEAYMQSLKDGNYERIFGIKLHILEKKIIHTKLNGYEVSDFLNKKARQIEMTVFTSFMSDVIPQKVQSVLEQYFHFDEVNFNSYALSSWFAVREIFPHEQNFLFLDISGEITDVMLNEHGVIAESGAFPQGRNNVLRSIVSELAVTPEVAVSFLNLHIRRAIEPKLAEKMNKVMKQIQETWRTQFIKTLQSFTNYQSIPKKIFITADHDTAEIFAEALKQEMPKGLNVAQNTFDVIVIGTDVTQACARSQQPKLLDTFIALESAFLNKIVL